MKIKVGINVWSLHTVCVCGDTPSLQAQPHIGRATLVAMVYGARQWLTLLLVLLLWYPAFSWLYAANKAATSPSGWPRRQQVSRVANPWTGRPLERMCDAPCSAGSMLGGGASVALHGTLQVFTCHRVFRTLPQG